MREKCSSKMVVTPLQSSTNRFRNWILLLDGEKATKRERKGDKSVIPRKKRHGCSPTSLCHLPLSYFSTVRHHVCTHQHREILNKWGSWRTLNCEGFCKGTCQETSQPCSDARTNTHWTSMDPALTWPNSMTLIKPLSSDIPRAFSPCVQSEQCVWSLLLKLYI